MKTRKEAIIQGLKSYDYLLAALVVGIGIFGVVMIYSAAVNDPGVGDVWRQQRFFIITGAVLMIGFSILDYRLIGKMYLVIYGFLMAMLVALVIIGPDPITNTARWLPIPIPGVGRISLQPSEFAKIFMIIFLAKLLDIKQHVFNRVLWLGLVLATIGVPVAMVALQPSMSAALVILFASITVLFVAGLKFRYIIIAVTVIVPIALILWFDLQRENPLFLYRIFREYQVLRVRTLIYPDCADAARQVEQSIRAIANGGLRGTGFMSHTSPLIFAHNDLIFSVVAEQFGFVGGAAVIGVILLIVIKCCLIAVRAVDLQGRLIAAGVAGMLVFETFVHVGVVTGLTPATGMPFPFLSYGGSMIWVHMIAIGIVLNVGLKRDVNEDDEILY